VPPPPSHDLTLRITAESLPPAAEVARYLGPFRLAGAWVLRSSNEMVFGYSALIARPGGSLLAFNDAGGTLRLEPPGAGRPGRIEACWLTMRGGRGLGLRAKAAQDVESAVPMPGGGYRLGLESNNEIVGLSPSLIETGRVAPRLMHGWGVNTGPEAMTRLPDGRFVVLREITTSIFEPKLHEAVLFDGDPLTNPNGHRFWFAGADNFSAVDMAMLPDGRALILMRRLIWPLPMRYAGRIVIADTRQIRAGGVWRSVTLASLASVLPVDNFEAIAAVPQPNGRVTVWLLSDDNRMRVLQRTLLRKLSVDPRQLPWPKG
jgi:hypothetical protein